MIDPEAVVVLNHLDAMIAYRTHQAKHFAHRANTAGDPAHKHFVSIVHHLTDTRNQIHHLRTDHVDASDHSRPRAIPGSSTGP